MIVGIGTDIVRIDRIEALHARYGERFARRVLGPAELAEYARRLARPLATATAAHREAAHREAAHREAAHREAAHREAAHREAAQREATPREAAGRPPVAGGADAAASAGPEARPAPYIAAQEAAARGEARAVRYLAKRFAAKEAFSKAIGLGLRAPMTLLSLEILNDARGAPVARPRLALAPWLQARRWRAHVSLSDEVDAALAFVVVEQGNE